MSTTLDTTHDSSQVKIPIKDVLGVTDRRVTRRFTKDYFTWWYDDSSLKDILSPAKGKWVAQSELLYSGFDVAKENAKRNNKKHQWTWAEDEFIRGNYKYLSDNVIGLGLNIPGRWVKLRRLALGLSKGVTNGRIQDAETYKVVIWCERSMYDSDVSARGITKQRPTYVYE